MGIIKVCLGDITEMAVDAIVNAANSSLLGGGGVDGAIHRAGGPAILAECRDISARQGGCAVGAAVITTAGELPAKYVIHTVGPVWQDGQQQEAALLRQAYDSCFDVAAAHDVRSMAFPNISTGVYRFPKPEAAAIAWAALQDNLVRYPQIETVWAVCFDAESLALYEALGQSSGDGHGLARLSP
ncbi:MAG: O-acetyl-ADP-ribose deacetylase [Neisseriaceae bacterium]|nr:O-acetyl-ADP-ribose deacetylase [Neisseriaceae bacterium]